MLYLGISETHQAQLKIIEALTRKFKLDPEIRLDLVAEQCPFNYTGADFYALCSDAMLKAMSRKAEDVDRTIGVYFHFWQATCSHIQALVAAELNSRPPHSNGQTAPLTPQFYLAELATPAEIEVLVAQQDFEAALAEVRTRSLSVYVNDADRASFSTADPVGQPSRARTLQASASQVFDGNDELGGQARKEGPCERAARKGESERYHHCERALG